MDIRRIDYLGRVVIPKSIRCQLNLKEEDPVAMVLNSNNEIVLYKYEEEKTLKLDRLKVGDTVKHFKREIADLEKDPSLYLYKILDIATHTETKDKLVVYQALYSNEEMGVNYGVYARPYDMFMGEVDHLKYPNIKQKYRFEKFY